MAGSERIKVMRVLTNIINDIDNQLSRDDLGDVEKKKAYNIRRKVWLLHQSILTAELDERITITKAKTKALVKVANELDAADNDLKAVADKIKMAAKAVDKLVEMTGKAVELAASVAPLL